MKKVFIIVLCTLLLAACGEEDSVTNKESLESEELVKNNSIEDVYDRTTPYAGQTFYKIDDQCFSLNMNPLGNIDFKAYEPAEGTADSDILLEIWQDGEVLMKLTDPLEPTFSNDKVELEAVSFDDLNEDGYDDIIAIIDYETMTIDAEGNEIIADNFWVKIFIGNSHGAMMEDYAYEEAVVVNMVDDTIDSAKESARKYIGMISNED